MNSHPILYEELIAYAAGELTKDEFVAIERHLAICAECATTVARFQSIGVLLRTDAGETPPASTVARAQNLFSQYKRAKQLRRIENGLVSIFQASRLSPATALLVLLIANLLLYVGIGVAMAQNTVPGDFQYPLKTGIEDFKVMVTLRDSDKVKLYLDLAGTRLEEIQTEKIQQHFEKIPDTAIAYEGDVQHSSDSLSAVLKKDLVQAKTLAQLMQITLNQYADSLTALSQGVPADIQPAFQHAILISGSAVSVALQVINMPAIMAQPTVSSISPGLGVPTPVSSPLPVPTYTRVWINAQPVPTVVPSIPGKLPLPPTARPPPGNTPSVAVERCQLSVQPKPSGFINQVTMAGGIRDPDGEPINPKEEFKPKDKVYAVAHVQNALANTKFKALWCVTDVGQAALPDTKLGEYEFSTDRTRNIYFSLASSAELAAGRYRVEIYVNGVLDTVRQFSVK